MKNLIFKLINKYFLAIVLMIVHLIILLKIQFIAWPEMLSYPYLLNKGYLPYQDIINPYTPFLIFFLKIFYSTVSFNLISLRIITYLIIIISDFLLFYLISKIFDFKIGLTALFLYVFLQPVLEGNGLWFDLFLVPFLITAFFISFKFLQKQSRKTGNFYLLILGFLISLCFLVKQTCGVFFVSIIILLLKNSSKAKRRIGQIVIFACSFLTPIIISFFFFYFKGLFTDYLFWAYQYPFQHLSSSGFSLLPTGKQLILCFILLIPSLLILIKYFKERKICLTGYYLLPCFIFVLPRFSYLHLQPMLPFIALCLSYFIVKHKDKKLIIMGYLLIIIFAFGYLLSKNLNKQPRFYNQEKEKKVLLIKEKIGENKVFFYNLSSEYFVIGDFLPTKPWADNFPWYLETKTLQERIILSLEKDNTTYVVFQLFNQEGPFTPGSYKPQLINQYIESNYKLADKIDETIWILKRN